MTPGQRTRAMLEITILGTLAVLIVFALYQGMNP